MEPGALSRAGAVGQLCPGCKRRLRSGKRRHSAFIGVSSHLIQQNRFLKNKVPSGARPLGR